MKLFVDLRFFVRSLVCFFGFACIPLFSQTTPKEQSTVTIIENGSQGVVFSLNPFNIRLNNFYLTGKQYKNVEIPGYGLLTIPGFPALPESGVLLQVPPNADLKVVVLDDEFEVITDIDVVPAAQIIEDLPTDQVSYRYEPDLSVYGSNSFWPVSLAGASARGNLRGRQVVRIRINPVQYNPVTRKLRVHNRLKVRVTWRSSQKTSAKLKQLHSANDPFNKLAKSLISNYSGTFFVEDQEIKVQSHQRDFWYDPQAEYTKLMVNEEGIYSVTYAELQNAGVVPNQFDMQALKIYNQGEEIPIWIDGPLGNTLAPGNTIYFYGSRNRSGGAFYDLYSDTNVYWLTSAGQAGKRYRLISDTSQTSNRSPFYWHTVHLEEDNLFYRSNGSSKLDPEEGWIWRYFFDNDRKVIEYDVSGFVTATPFCSLRVRLQGTTLDPVQPDHHIHLFVNNQVVDDVYFDDRNELIHSVAFPADLIKNGKNNVKIYLVADTGALINQIYLDWVEIVYPRHFVATAGNLKFSPGVTPERNTEFKLVNFDDEDVFVLNPTASRLWLPGTRKASIYHVESAAFDDGFFLRISADFEPVIFSKRGHGLVAIAPFTREINIRNYDTFASADAADAMAAFIDSLAPGTVVLVGILDEGSAQMTEAAQLALESLGSSLSRQVEWRDSWALIGRKGAPAGSVTEVISRRTQGPAVAVDTLIDGQAFRYLASFKDTAAASFYYAASGTGFKNVKAMVKEQNSDLHSVSNGADYIIITHNDFRLAAQDLADFRSEHNGFRTMVVDIHDIYDEFNAGIISPVAIKSFLQYAYSNWQAPAPAYIVLFGDASWDPKKHLPESVKTNYVPSYGSLMADNWFVAFDGPNEVLPNMFIGRIPVESAGQAAVVINKIKAYATAHFDSWNKEIIFFNGGFNATEQSIFLSQTNRLISQYIEPPPFSGKPFNFNKTSTEAITQAFLNSAIVKINQGVLWVNFLGHAGSTIWDIDIGQPDDWQNMNVFPFITGMSCHSARFANPVVNSISEDFVLNSIGAAAYWGSTGFGYIIQDFYLLDGLFNAVTRDTVRSIGEATTRAKWHAWQQLGDDNRTQNVIQQYTLIGDPAMRLKVATKPEFAVGDSEILLSSDLLLAVNSTATISSKIHNFGLTPTDSVAVAISVHDPDDVLQEIGIIEIESLRIVDSVSAKWDLPDAPGQYEIKVFVDVENRIAEDDEFNNVAHKNVIVYTSDLALVKPLPFGVIGSSNPALVTSNSRFTGENLTYTFEVDTSNKFNSPARQQTQPLTEGSLITQWQPQLTNEGIHFWRVRTFDGSNSGPWAYSSFNYLQANGNAWYQNNPQQFDNNLSDNILAAPQFAELLKNRRVFGAESAGFSDGARALLTTNNQSVGIYFRGHNVAVFSPTFEFREFQVFDTFADVANAESMTNLVNSLQEGNFVLVAILDEGSVAMTESAYQALESIGSQFTRQVGFRDSWAIIGRKGAPIGSVPEVWKKSGEGPAVVSDTLTRFFKNGKMTSVEIGPALEWRSAKFDYTSSFQNERIAFNVLGRNRATGSIDTLQRNLTQITEVDLSGIDPKLYRKIRLQALMASANGLESPKLFSWSVDYEPTADLVVDRNSLTVDSDTVTVGEEVKVTIEVGNFGLNPSGKFAISLTAKARDSAPVEVAKVTVNKLKIDEVAEYHTSFSSEGFLGNIKLTAELDAANEVAEILETNNAVTSSVWVKRDTSGPEIRVTFDGINLVDGEFVAANPAVTIELRDRSVFAAEDTNRVTILLDDKKINYGSASGQARLLPQQNPDDAELRALVVFSPELTASSHTLQVIVRDVSNNSGCFEADFFVSDEFILNEVMNYPNPFSGATDFIYKLTQPAEQVRIKVYTIAGRLIITFDNLPSHAGFNQVRWDGRDRQGDSLANGVYLYKVIARSQEKQVEVIEKLVVMR